MTAPRERWQDEHLRYDLPHLRLRQVAALVAAAQPRRVLDIGCATGHLRRLLPGAEYVGCDFAAPPVAPEFEFHQRDLNREGLPRDLGHFDAVVCSGILEYVESPEQLLRDVACCLIPSGKFVCSYFNDRHVLRQATRLLRLQPYRHPDWTDLQPLEALRAQLAAAGLLVRSCHASTFGIGPAPAVGRTVSRPVRLAPLARWAEPFAHQFVLACVRSG